MNNFTQIGGACVPSVNNATVVSLVAAETFTGLADFIIDFAEITVSLFAQPAAARGTVYLEFSPDGIHWDTSIPLMVSDPTAFVPFPLRIVQPYFRVRYVNGATAQTEFRLSALYHRTGVKHLTRLQGQSIGPLEPTEVMRALVEPSIASRHMAIAADRAIFGASVVGSRQTHLLAHFDLPFADNSTTPTTSGGATLSQLDGEAILSTGAAATVAARLETRRRVSYSPGNEIYVMFTARFTTPTHADSYQRIGIYDDSNGFFIGYNGLDFGHTRRRVGVDSFFSRAAAWNGDPADGSGVSRFTRNEVPEPLNLTRFNIYRIRFGWLGSASAVFEVMAPDGHWVLLHTATVPNALSVPHIASPILPVRCEVSKTGADATVLQLGTCSWNAGVVTGRPLDDTYEEFTGVAAEGVGPAIDLSYLGIMEKYALRVQPVGGSPNWDVRLEVDLTNNFLDNRTEILDHRQSDGAGATKFVTGKPARYMRYRVANLSGGAGTLNIQLAAMR